MDKSERDQFADDLALLLAHYGVGMGVLLYKNGAALCCISLGGDSASLAMATEISKEISPILTSEKSKERVNRAGIRAAKAEDN